MDDDASQEFSAADAYYMPRALDDARAAADIGEAPVGAVLIDHQRAAAGAADFEAAIIAGAGNRPISTSDPTAHAEIMAIRAGAKARGNYRLMDTTLYVTLEPCVMCAGAISHARITRLVIAASDPKGGGVWHGPRFFEQPTCHWRPQIVQGPYAEEAGDLLRAFFRARRKR